MFPIEFFRRSALTCPDSIAAVDGDRSCTYRELLARCNALAAGIQAVTSRPRPTVAILGPNSMEMLVALLAIHASGSILVPLNGRNAKPELDAQLRRVPPDLLIVHREYLDKFTPIEAPVLVADAEPSDERSMVLVEQRHAGQQAQWDATLSDVNAIKFTGGSSGIPKGVMQSFRCLNTHVTIYLLSFDFQSTDRYLCAAPMTHGAGALILPMLARGACVVMTADPKPASLLELIERHGITSTWMPPTMLYGLIDEQRALPRDVESLSHLIWGGAAAAPARLQEARQVFGPVVETVYGQTEAPMVLSVARAQDIVEERHLASVGRVPPLVEVAILDPEGRRLAAGEVGEICARGDLVMNGYYEMPEETAKTFAGGWLHTGDGGYLDADGFLFLKDRIRDVVISGGFNVYPSDVEAAIAQHAAVSEVVVFGVPDAHWGERVEAALELRSGYSATAEELIAFCKERVGSVKTPKKIHIVQTLPRSTVGKVLRREARSAAVATTDGAVSGS